MAFGPAKLDGDVLAVDIAGLFQTNPKARNIVRKWLRRGAVEEPNHRQSALLRTRSERPRYGGAADKCECDEFPSPHGFARAEDSVGYKKTITFWIENRAVLPPERARPHVRFGSKADIEGLHSMSALPPKADIAEPRK